MRQAKIESSQFQAGSITYYDEVNNYLYITFANGAIYRYDNVPDSVFELLQTSSSAGKYFNNAIRGVYNYKRVVEIPVESVKEEVSVKEPEMVENTSGVVDFKEPEVVIEADKVSNEIEAKITKKKSSKSKTEKD